MRTLRLFIATLLCGVGLTALAGPAHADYPTYAFRACWDFGASTHRGHMCIKIYVKRQEDGQGLVSKNRHIYAWTTDGDGDVSQNCGVAFQDPAADPSFVSLYSGNQSTPNWRGFSPLTDANGCDVQWSENELTARDYQVTTWTVQPRQPNTPDGPVQTLRLSVGEQMGWSCTVPEQNASDYCARFGPY